MCVFFTAFPKLAQVAELADALDLGSSTARCGGSTPPLGTMLRLAKLFYSIPSLVSSNISIARNYLFDQNRMLVVVS